ncbi:hypothetical protein C4D60_Mb07t25730 [Musa balbisiana]|uniref:Uncharacterized protein n=1 Tax=Musa balbisiana TaxID=52838 RepID=A0A4V4H6X6_MUSBA|nr:hypothetical protein C4D60_Mb07t25730 [Musa balbisiana]
MPVVFSPPRDGRQLSEPVPVVAVGSEQRLEDLSWTHCQGTDLADASQQKKNDLTTTVNAWKTIALHSPQGEEAVLINAKGVTTGRSLLLGRPMEPTW